MINHVDISKTDDLITVCRLAYRYLLDEMDRHNDEPKRLTESDRKRLGKQLAQIYADTHWSHKGR